MNIRNIIITAFLALLPAEVSAATIPNGGSVAGAISVNGEIDSHTFSGVSGQQGVVSVSGNVSTGEHIRVFNPDGSSLANTTAQASVTLTQTGQYTVLVSSIQATGTGNYQVHLALAPGANEHGLIPNGDSLAQTIDDNGEIDSFSFQGVSGQSGALSISGNVSGGEYYRVYNPNGTLLTSDSDQAFVNLTQTGTYTIIVSSFQASGTGNYVIYVALAPGANEHGLIPNGGSLAQTIDDNGEIDSFTFQGVSGQSGTLSISGNVSGGEYYRVYNPNGTLLTSDSDQAFVNLTQTGTYTIIVSSFQASGTGNYVIYVALAPGANEHGLIPNGGSVSETISDNGEIDSFTFNGSTGQAGTISIAGSVSTGEFMRIFNPSGSQLQSTSGQVSLELTQSGTYTVIAHSFQASGTGPYSINLALNAATMPTVQIIPSALDFGDVPVGQIKTETLMIGNGGTGTLQPGAATIQGVNAGSFFISQNTCPGAQLAAGQTCALSVIFLPTATGVHQATLQISSNAPTSPSVVPMRGAGGILLRDGFENN